jgi:hypothetical protein
VIGFAAEKERGDLFADTNPFFLQGKGVSQEVGRAGGIAEAVPCAVIKRMN